MRHAGLKALDAESLAGLGAAFCDAVGNEDQSLAAAQLCVGRSQVVGQVTGAERAADGSAERA